MRPTLFTTVSSKIKQPHVFVGVISALKQDRILCCVAPTTEFIGYIIHNTL